MRGEPEWLEGEYSAYPGHPWAIAWIIINEHPSYEHAFGYECVAKGCTEKWHSNCSPGYPRALTNSNVPGSGCAVDAGLDILKKLRDGMDPELVNRIADYYWENVKRQGFKDYDKGKLQGEKARPKVVKSTWWHRPRT